MGLGRPTWRPAATATQDAPSASSHRVHLAPLTDANGGGSGDGNGGAAAEEKGGAAAAVTAAPYPAGGADDAASATIAAKYKAGTKSEGVVQSHWQPVKHTVRMVQTLRRTSKLFFVPFGDDHLGAGIVPSERDEDEDDEAGGAASRDDGLAALATEMGFKDGRAHGSSQQMRGIERRRTRSFDATLAARNQQTIKTARATAAPDGKKRTFARTFARRSDETVLAKRINGPSGSNRGSSSNDIGSGRRQTLQELLVGTKVASAERATLLEFPAFTWLVNPNGPFFKAWSAFMFPCIVYTAVVTPFEIAFIDRSCALLIPNLFVDVYFLSDIAVNFSTSTYDWEKTKYITSRYTLARNYASSWFLIDAASCLPIDAIVVAARTRNLLFVLRSTYTCTTTDSGALGLFAMLKLVRLLKLLRVLRIGRLVARFAAKTQISYKSQTIIKFSLLVVGFTHMFACVIRIVGAPAGCVATVAAVEAGASDRRFAYETANPSCWFATVRFRNRGVWRVYVAALDWAIKAMIGDALTITFGEKCAGFFVMMIGCIVMAFLIGEIANVLTNFDPALNDYRSTMDKLNYYMHEQKITKPLQVLMREYFINSESLFRQAYHREMLSNLSPQLQRAAATEELGAWVRNIPFLNDALLSVGARGRGRDAPAQGRGRREPLVARRPHARTDRRADAVLDLHGAVLRPAPLRRGARGLPVLQAARGVALQGGRVREARRPRAHPPPAAVAARRAARGRESRVEADRVRVLARAEAQAVHDGRVHRAARVHQHRSVPAYARLRVPEPAEPEPAHPRGDLRGQSPAARRVRHARLRQRAVSKRQELRGDRHGYY